MGMKMGDWGRGWGLRSPSHSHAYAEECERCSGILGKGKVRKIKLMWHLGKDVECERYSGRP